MRVFAAVDEWGLRLIPVLLIQTMILTAVDPGVETRAAVGSEAAVQNVEHLIGGGEGLRAGSRKSQ